MAMSMAHTRTVLVVLHFPLPLFSLFMEIGSRWAMEVESLVNKRLSIFWNRCLVIFFHYSWPPWTTPMKPSMLNLTWDRAA